ncbi:zinc-dependent alcohol dehydrogenase [Microbacterium terrisoli]|jgi:L-iditol 2-dehydrogenase|uniref:zinc-dependent alcohol dehydrogenase n=1 Tax=Microbacterium terrisoli TaxID=3242192 RepID=UPI002804DCA0|nr:alcohol dehydrogenase catalytic domain-containing protein [Microbacterium protaetiae]
MTSTLPATDATMRAVVKTGPGPENVVVSTVPVPQTPAGFARVHVIATGICGTDVHVAHDEYGYEAPVVMGHEILGRVAAVGSETDAGWVGTRVACETYFSACERCDMCRAGRRNLCTRRRSLGSFEDGGFAEQVVLPTMNLHALPEWLGEFDGALSEPLACVAQCLMDPPVVAAGDRVLVTGPGAMGQLAAQVASAHGGHVTLSGLARDAERLQIAQSLGIQVTTEPVEEGAFDVVLECSGSAAGAATAFRAARRRARYVQIGIFGREVSLPFDEVLYKELTVTSGFASTPTSWRHAMTLIEQQRVQLGPLVTRRVELEDFAAALQAAQSGEGLKTVVVPSRA